MKFKREYLARWIGSEVYENAYKLCVQYEYKCEQYDRSICTLFDEDGFAVPKSTSEHRQMYSNAISKQDYLRSERKRLGIDNKTWQEARKEVNRLSFDRLEQEYKRIVLQ